MKIWWKFKGYPSKKIGDILQRKSVISFKENRWYPSKKIGDILQRKSVISFKENRWYPSKKIGDILQRKSVISFKENRWYPSKKIGKSTRMWFLDLDMGRIWCTKYFKYGYILLNEIICEDLMKITQIIGKIWTHLFLWISLKIAKLYDRHY